MWLRAWIAAGQSFNEFWDYSWAEASIILEGATRRDAHLAWLNARFSAWAYHDPANIPADPATANRQKSDQELEADRIRVRATLIAMANRGKLNG